MVFNIHFMSKTDTINKIIKEKIKKIFLGNAEEPSDLAESDVFTTYRAEALMNELAFSLEKAIQEAKEEILKKAISILTENISQKEFRGNWKQRWEYKNNRGIEPCLECNNRDNIFKFLESLSLKEKEGENDRHYK